jgi:DNA-binding winged helix-turn-helix (wHTH) protein
VSLQKAAMYRFGVFELDPRVGELRKNGVKRKLQDQPHHVLVKLLEHPGEIVSREELRSALWHEDTFVDFETGLNTAIKRLRETLGDSADNPTFIETLPRRGYKFIAAVEIPVSQDSKMSGPANRQETPREKNLLKRG